MLCSARGHPNPVVTWLMSDGSPVTNVEGLRHVEADGTLVFPPFRAEEYRQDVHATVYRCSATNSIGTLISKEVRIRGVVIQDYDVYVYDVYTIRGNSAIMKCHVPSFMMEYIMVTSWIRDSVVTISSKPLDPNAKYSLMPNGDLYVRHVSPNDGMTSFRCQTTHRLTGESKNSISAGKLFVTEPQGNVPPKITNGRKMTTAREGEVVLLPCVAQGNPPPTVSWSRRVGLGSPVRVMSNGRVVQVGGSLVIRATQVTDAGLYVCNATNSVGSETTEMELLLTVALSVTVQPTFLVVDAGKAATFTCAVSGAPVASLTWVKDGAALNHDSFRLINNETLHIDTVTSAHNGVYQCFASNEIDVAYGAATLTLGDSMPIFINVFEEKVLQPGPTVTLSCTASGSPVPSITWSLDDMELPDDGRIMLEQSVDGNNHVTSAITIKNIKIEDGGLYKCTAVNKAGRASYWARLNIYGKPSVRRKSKVTAINAETVTLNCPMFGYPIQSVKWERGVASLPDDIRQVVYRNGTLLIKNVHRTADSGTYNCIVSNQHGQTARGVVQLIVMVPPKISSFSFQDEPVREGMRGRLQCVVLEGDLPLTIEWQKDSHSIPESLGINIRNIDEFSSILTIPSITPRHNGKYTCVARNAAATVTHTATLSVNVPPKWIDAPRDMTATSGEEIFLHCRAEGLPTPTVTWMREVEDSLQGHRTAVTENFNTHIFFNGTLRLSQVTKEHEGQYFCTANNGVGLALSKAIYLTVHAPPHFDSKFQTAIGKRGENTTLVCQAYGDLPIDFTWAVGAYSINPQKDIRYGIQQSEYVEAAKAKSELTIAWLDRKDSEAIRCMAQNRFGIEESEFRLTVQDKPDAPHLEVPVQTGNRSVRLTWKPPFDGNSQIVEYMVVYKKQIDSWQHKSWNATVDSSKTFTIIEGLAPATRYHFRLMAVNAVGHSDYSEAITVTTEEDVPAGPPLHIEVESTDTHTLRVIWKPPKKSLWNGPIRGYYIGYKQHNTTDPYIYTTLEVPEDYSEDLIYQLQDLRMFTQYSIVVQAYNNKGPGPHSEAIIAMTSEDVPSSPPRDIRCSALSSKSIYILWEAPQYETVNGILRGYKVHYKPVEEWYDAAVLTKLTQTPKITLQGLLVNTNYSIQILAFTKVGDGVRSSPIYCKTHEDVPEAPVAIKVLAASSDSVMVSWKPPSKSSGSVTKYNIYYKPLEDGQELDLESLPSGDSSVRSDQLTRDASVHSSPSDAQFFEVKGLKKNRKYAFWVTASSIIGEGPGSPVMAQTVADSIVAAKSASFDDVIKTAWKRDVVMSCKAVGIPSPQRKWTYSNKPVESKGRLTLLSDGALMITRVISDDAGNYTCSIYNEYGRDNINYALIIQVPPAAPTLDVISKSRTSIQLQWKPGPNGGDAIRGYILHYKRDTGSWEAKELRPDLESYSLEGLGCGTTYQIYMEAFNTIGTGAPCDVITVSTEGAEIAAPSKEHLIREGTTFITVSLDSWPTSGCPILYFGVEYKQQTAKDWTIASTNMKPTQKKMVIPNLASATWYILRITSHTSGGALVSEYQFATHTINGGTIAPELYEEEIEPVYIFYLDPYIFIPAVALLIIAIIIALFVCLYIRRRNESTGTPSVFSEPTSNATTWTRNAIQTSAEALEQEKFASLARKNNRVMTLQEPSPYATSKLPGCFPENQEGGGGTGATTPTKSHWFSPHTTGTLQRKSLYPDMAVAPEIAPFPGYRTDSLQQNPSESDFRRIEETTFVFPPQVNQSSYTTPVKHRRQQEGRYDHPTFEI